MAPGIQRYTEPYRQFDSTTLDVYQWRADETTLPPDYDFGKRQGQQRYQQSQHGRQQFQELQSGRRRFQQSQPGRQQQRQERHRQRQHGRDDMPEEMAECFKTILQHQGNKIPYLACTIA